MAFGGDALQTDIAAPVEAIPANGNNSQFQGALETARQEHHIQLAQAPGSQPVPETQLDAAAPNRVRICADNACVFVDAGSGGMTEQGIARFSFAYRDFIRANDGLDLSPYRADVVGLDREDVRRVSVASQFIGYNLPNGWGNTRIFAGSSRNVDMPGDSAGRMDRTWVRSRTPQEEYHMSINMDWGDHRINPSGLARTMIHEYLHRQDQMGMVTIVNDQHRAIDAEARNRIMDYGLGTGGCLPVGGGFLFGLFPPTYPGCN